MIGASVGGRAGFIGLRLDSPTVKLYASQLKEKVVEPIPEKPIIEEFKRRIEQRFPGELVRLIIFGSKVRGEATPESDVDLLAVIQSDNWRLGDEIRGVGYALELEHGVVLSIQVISRNHYERLRAGRTQFFQVLEQEGVVV